MAASLLSLIRIMPTPILGSQRSDWLRTCTLVGGKTGFVCEGTFQANGNQTTAKLRIVQDDPGTQSIFGPLTDFEPNV
jgi:hypothetical protein